MGDYAHRRRRTLYVLFWNGESSHKTTGAVRTAGRVLEVNSLEHACLPRLLQPAGTRRLIALDVRAKDALRLHATAHGPGKTLSPRPASGAGSDGEVGPSRSRA